MRASARSPSDSLAAVPSAALISQRLCDRGPSHPSPQTVEDSLSGAFLCVRHSSCVFQPWEPQVSTLFYPSALSAVPAAGPGASGGSCRATRSAFGEEGRLGRRFGVGRFRAGFADTSPSSAVD